MIYTEMISRLIKLISKRKSKIGHMPESCVDILKKILLNLNTIPAMFHFSTLCELSLHNFTQHVRTLCPHKILT